MSVPFDAYSLAPALETCVFLFQQPSRGEANQRPKQYCHQTRHLDTKNTLCAGYSGPYLMCRDHSDTSNSALPREPLASCECSNEPLGFGESGLLDKSSAAYIELPVIDTRDRFYGGCPFRPTLDVFCDGPHDFLRCVNMYDIFKLHGCDSFKRNCMEFRVRKSGFST